jgi:hypothetical protein
VKLAVSAPGTPVSKTAAEALDRIQLPKEAVDCIELLKPGIVAVIPMPALAAKPISS